MNRKLSTIVAAVLLLLGVAFLMGGCTKPKATISPAKLSLRIGETNEVSVNFQGISSYRFEIEDTNVADFPSEASSSSNVPLDGSVTLSIIGKHVGNTNLFFLCPNEDYFQQIPVEVRDNH